MVKKATKAQAPKKARVPAKKPIEKPQKPANPVFQRLEQPDGSKWRLNNLKMGQYLSWTQYLTVTSKGN